MKAFELRLSVLEEAKKKIIQMILPPGRMGNCRRALQMIMEELEDVDKAIEFAKEQDDAELWEDLISYSIDKPRMTQPSSNLLILCLLFGLTLSFFILFFTVFVSAAFITGLLNNIGTHVDPILLIHRIKEGMEIPNLRDSLVKILQDYNLQVYKNTHTHTHIKTLHFLRYVSCCGIY